MNMLKEIPQSYKKENEKGGTVVRVDYVTKTYDEKNETLEKYALVYLPYGYDESKKYPVFYMLHGGGGVMEFYFHTDGSSTLFKNYLDNMIANGDVEPLIVVAPTYYPLKPCDRSIQATFDYIKNFHYEIVNDLIPAVEGKFSTYAKTTDKEGLIASRDYRAFGGFSMGSLATWYTFIYCLDEFRYFMPMSGDCWVMGEKSGKTHPKETAEYLENAVLKSGHSPDDFFIYALTGEKDIAFEPMDSQIKAMKIHAPSFKFITDENPGGNICFRVHPEGVHNHDYVEQYIYNALPTFWSGAPILDII
jgi:enterochelin esterase-like enzyme